MEYYPDFIKSTGYGTPEGLLGVNCRHGYVLWREGMEKPDRKKASDRKYRIEQQKRHMEKIMRRNERRLVAAETEYKLSGSGIDAARMDAVYKRLQTQRTEYERFCKKHEGL